MVGDAFNGSLGVSELPFVYLRPSANILFGAAMLAIALVSGVLMFQVYGLEGVALAVLLTVIVVNVSRIAASRWMFGLSVVEANLVKPLTAAASTLAIVWTLRSLVGGPPAVGYLLGLPLLLGAFFGMLWLLKLEREDQAQLSRILTRFR